MNSAPLTHWGRVTHKCVSKLTIIGSDNGLSPGRRQAIIWTNAGILLIGGPLVWLHQAVKHYRKVSNIRRTKAQNLNASRVIL